MAVQPDGRGAAGEADALAEVDEDELEDEAEVVVAVVVVAATEVELEEEDEEADLEAEEEALEEIEDEAEAEAEAPPAGPEKTVNLDPAPQVCCEFPAQTMLHWIAGATALAAWKVLPHQHSRPYSAPARLKPF